MNTEYLIIGNSAGGIAAAEAIREVDKKGSLTIVSDENCPSYSRPLISKILSHERDMDGILFRPADFYEKNKINFLKGKKVTRLDTAKRIAELDDGQKISWQKLLLATGGRPIVPPVEGFDKKGVFNFISLADSNAIDAYLGSSVKRAVVIGGGLIGTSAAEALVKRGVAVTMVEMKDRILNTILDAESSHVAAEALELARVNIITGHTVNLVKGDEAVSAAVLDDGREIPAEMVVVAIGVLPRVELAQSADIKINRGIVVDMRMETNVSGVYACGDAAEAYDFIYGAGRVVPIWPNAFVGGRTAGFNMAGKETEYAGGTAMNSLNYFGLDIVTAGMVMPPEEEGYQVFSRQDNGNMRRVIIHQGKVVGMVFIGDIEKTGIIFGLMRDRVNVGNKGESLLSPDFGLVKLSRKIRRGRLAVPTGTGLHEVIQEEEPEEEDLGVE